jgi:hypothetical protein
MRHWVLSGNSGVGMVRHATSRGAWTAQRLQPACLPLGVPAADVLPGHPQVAGDFGLGVAGGKPRPGLHADVFERLAVTQAAGCGGRRLVLYRHAARTTPDPVIGTSELL